MITIMQVSQTSYSHDTKSLGQQPTQDWKLEMEQKINGRTESIATLTDELRGSIPLQATMKEIIYTKDKAYQLVRVLKEDQLKNPNMEDLKKFFNCDTLLRKQGLLYFCRLIEDVEYEESTDI